MKWQFRKWADKCMLFLVNIKPVRWFFDQLIQLGEWAKENSFLRVMSKWYRKLERPFWIIYGSCWSLYYAWQHDIWGIIGNICGVLLCIILTNDWHKPDDPDDDDSPDGPDPTPNGDAIDRWLREQQKVK